MCDRPPHNRTTPAWSGAGAPLKQEKRLSPPEHTQACQLNASKSVTPFHTKKLLHRRAFAPEAVHITRSPYKSLQEDDLDVTETWTWHTWPGHDYSLTKTLYVSWQGQKYDMTRTWPAHGWTLTATNHLIQARPPCGYQGKRSKRSITSRINLHRYPSPHLHLQWYIGSCLNTEKPVQSIKVKTGESALGIGKWEKTPKVPAVTVPAFVASTILSIMTRWQRMGHAKIKQQNLPTNQPTNQQTKTKTNQLMQSDSYIGLNVFSRNIWAAQHLVPCSNACRCGIYSVPQFLQKNQRWLVVAHLPSWGDDRHQLLPCHNTDNEREGLRFLHED